MPEIKGIKVWKPCPSGHGDFNHDGVIDEKDWNLFNGCYSAVTSKRPECIAMDFRGRGQVTIIDFSIFATIVDQGRCPKSAGHPDDVILEEVKEAPPWTPGPEPITIWSYLPMSPMIGPPLPRILGIKWPWIKE